MSSAKPQYVPKPEEISRAIRKAIGETDGGSPPFAKSVHIAIEKEHPGWKISEKRVAKLLKKLLKEKSLGDPQAPSHCDDETSLSSDKKRRKSALAKAGTSLRKFVSPRKTKGPGKYSPDRKKSPGENSAVAPPPLESAPPTERAHRVEAPTESVEANLLPRLKSEDEEDTCFPMKGDAPTAETEELPELEEAQEASAEPIVRKEEVTAKEDAAAEEEVAVDEDVAAEPDAVERDGVYEDDNDGKKGRDCCEGTACIIL